MKTTSLFLRCLAALAPIVLAAAEPAPVPLPASANGLPVFHHQGVVLHYKDLKYNPANDVIIPSVIRADRYFQKPLGRYYMYYAPHNGPGGICLAFADKLEGPWREYEANPLIHKDWQPHYAVSHVSGPHAIWIEEERKMFLYFHGENDITRFASTTDGIHFHYEGTAVSTAMFDDITEASYGRIFRYPLPGKDNRYIMLLMGNSKGTRRIYVAWSKDGRKWETRRTPLLDPPPGTSQVAQAWLLPWRGKQYLVYHAHLASNEIMADLHVSEVDPSFEHTKYLGLFYPRTSVSPDNVAQMSPCIVEENGRLYLFTNIGPRLNQVVALAIAESGARPAQIPTAHAGVAPARSYLSNLISELEKDWPANRAVNIVCHGHSVPAGYFKTPEVRSLEAYPHLLREGLAIRFPHAVINVIVSSKGGENSVEGAARFERDVLAHQPDVVLIDYSLNDRKAGLEAARTAWVKMIRKAQDSGVKVILLTPTPDLSSTPQDDLEAHAAQVRRLASEFGTGLVDSLQAFKRAKDPKHMAELMSQGNHPNAEGHRLVASEILKYFEKK